ncbi:MAG TPA: hypothetical protein PKB05_09465 [Oligoflexia bacterium]|nr:hypothetical protein [Oligoflexia bacterium]
MKKNYRSAITRQFVTKDYANNNPETTVSERKKIKNLKRKIGFK